MLYALEPEGKTSIALTRAAAAMRRISEAAASLPAEAADQLEEGVAGAARTLKTERETRRSQLKWRLDLVAQNGTDLLRSPVWH